LISEDAISSASSREMLRDAMHGRVNALLVVVVLAISALQFFLAPLILPTGAWSAIAIVALCAMATPLHWGLMHESIHGNLFTDPSANRRAGRVLGAFLLLSWDVMRFGHLLHHSANRHEFDRPEAVPPGGSRLVAAGPYFLKLLGGHALISALSSAALVLPAKIVVRLIEVLAPGSELGPMRTAAVRAFTNAGRQTRIRTDLLLVLALIAFAATCWGATWPVFAISIGARFLVLSILDNAPHYGTAIDSGTKARNSELPGWATWLVTAQNFHGVHHGAPGLRWQELRPVFQSAAIGYDGTWGATVLRQFRGPLNLESLVSR
jgi:fatty acid desaturase